MTENFISLKNVNLHYASEGYKDRSLKSYLVKFFQETETSTLKDIHALKDISLSIKEGERVGILGHNGAGKTSLLKVIAGLYPTSSGEVKIQGEIRSLFDLSLGFEPDATGRENILYRGLLMGLSPSYIATKKREIIEFADLGEMIDYPLKTYSAGMMVRLAFAISTSVGGDILLLDEVIGAGDASFMAKARERITGLIENSKILVLASHDLGSLSAICSRGILLSQGHVIFDGDINEAIQRYQMTIRQVA